MLVHKLLPDWIKDEIKVWGESPIRSSFKIAWTPSLPGPLYLKHPFMPTSTYMYWQRTKNPNIFFSIWSSDGFICMCKKL